MEAIEMDALSAIAIKLAHFMINNSSNLLNYSVNSAFFVDVQ